VTYLAGDDQPSILLTPATARAVSPVDHCINGGILPAHDPVARVVAGIVLREHKVRVSTDEPLRLRQPEPIG